MTHLEIRLPITVSRQFIEDESGSNALEYGLLIALIWLSMASALAQLGLDIASVFTLLSGVYTTSIAN